MRKPFLHLCTFALLLPLFFQSLVFAGSDAGTVRGGLPRFTLEQAILTALQRNADIQRAKQEIERAKGVYLELRADALPRIDAGGTFLDTDPHLGRSNGDGGGPNVVREASYNFSLRATQIVFAGGGSFPRSNLRSSCGTAPTSRSGTRSIRSSHKYDSNFIWCC